MVVAADRKRETAKVAFMIPTKILVKAWVDLESIVIRTQEIEKPVKPGLLPAKIKSLEQQKKQIEECIESITINMGFEGKLANYLHLERELNCYFDKLEKIERQLGIF
ncbi:hypothetical protein [Moorena producens]|uniref:hypothetical protein n=1 Tax=Moorena producens TaxID=1155739 RepID=UPI003C729ECE